MKTVELPRTIVNQILTLSLHDCEHEVCGLVAIDKNSECSLYPVSNVAKDTVSQFEMDPHGLIQSMKQIRESGQTLLAIYHSHPHAPAIPSSIDIELNEYPDLLYLIVSLDTTGVLQMRGYYLHADKSTGEVELKFVEGS